MIKTGKQQNTVKGGKKICVFIVIIHPRTKGGREGVNIWSLVLKVFFFLLDLLVSFVFIQLFAETEYCKEYMFVKAQQHHQYFYFLFDTMKWIIANLYQDT